jgi:hypothetical protein
MARFSPKTEIINHFDNLINRIDIDIDSSLQKFKDQQLLSEILESSANNIKAFNNRSVEIIGTFYSPKDKVDSWPKSTSVVDYLKQIRMKTIDELRKAQEEALDYYKINSERFKSLLTNEKNIDELRSELFAEKFYFQIQLNQSKSRLCPVSVFTFVTDFYLPPSYIDLLE